MNTAIMYFSPTRGGERIALRLSSLLNCKVIDITLPINRFNLEIIKDVNLLYLITPVYGQNIPQVLKKYFQNLNYNGKLVLITVYGNIKIGGTLKYLQRCFKRPVIAGASFIGEHSYNTSDLKLSINRPNEDDLSKLNDLIALVDKRLSSNITINMKGRSNILALMIPRFILKFSSGRPIVIKECQHCKCCKIQCPTGAINDDLSIDKRKCNHCYCCVLVCRENNRQKKIFLATKWYLMKYSKQEKEVQIY